MTDATPPLDRYPPGIVSWASSLDPDTHLEPYALVMGPKAMEGTPLATLLASRVHVVLLRCDGPAPLTAEIEGALCRSALAIGGVVAFTFSDPRGPKMALRQPGGFDA